MHAEFDVYRAVFGALPVPGLLLDADLGCSGRSIEIGAQRRPTGGCGCFSHQDDGVVADRTPLFVPRTG